MTICDRFDVVVVLFPFTDVVVQRGRPALVLSNQAFNNAHGHSILAMITTAAQSSWPTDRAIGTLSVAGLKTASVVRFKVFTLSNALISRQIGTLAPADRQGLDAVLSRILH
ncbi:MAG: type II toxin-antitoxin system PemK/MazF family toxin [Hyphomicrobiaceae bacterium]